MNIYPSILTDEVEQVLEQVEICKESSLVQTVQIDIIDSFFVDNITVFPSDVSKVDFGDIKVDFHLMTQEPMDFVHEIKDSKEFLPVRAVLGQIEQMTSQVDFLQEVRKNEWMAGLSLNLHTPIESIDEEAWKYIDAIQIMGITAGFQGQEFNVSALEIISELRDAIEERGLDIEVIVDGGVKLDNVKEIADYGADGVAVGSALWRSSDFGETYDDFLN
jgi:ribulose-phosphate 3-epimerase